MSAVETRLESYVEMLAAVLRVRSTVLGARCTEHGGRDSEKMASHGSRCGLCGQAHVQLQASSHLATVATSPVTYYVLAPTRVH